MEYRILNEGDCALCVEFGSQIDDEINARVNGLMHILEKKRLYGVREYIPTFRSLFVSFDPLKVRRKHLIWQLEHAIREIKVEQSGAKRVVEIPVCYEAEYAPDMEQVMEHTGLSAEEIISLHSGRDYRIHMLGFLPGFPYLGGMDERLITPRLKTPRTRIEPGSVGIGGSQTGVYPLASPGGWQLIGKTPLCLYDPKRANPVLYEAGDFIRFVRISKEEFVAIEKKQLEESGLEEQELGQQKSR